MPIKNNNNQIFFVWLKKVKSLEYIYEVSRNFPNSHIYLKILFIRRIMNCNQSKFLTQVFRWARRSFILKMFFCIAFKKTCKKVYETHGVLEWQVQWIVIECFVHNVSIMVYTSTRIYKDSLTSRFLGWKYDFRNWKISILRNRI